MVERSFAEALKRLREAAGLSQPELAERAGMNRFGIAKLEQGVREPSWSTVLALAKALGVSLDTFRPDDDASGSQAQPKKAGRPRKPTPDDPASKPKRTREPKAPR